MSVFTNVSRQDLADLLSEYDSGELSNYEGIASGVENSNFFVDTTQGQFVLTLFERVSSSELPYFLRLTNYLVELGIPCAKPQVNKLGDVVSHSLTKPAALVQRLPGISIDTTTEVQCYEIGKLVAKMHQVSQHFPLYRANPYSEPWFASMRDSIAAKIDRATQHKIDAQLATQRLFSTHLLPRGTVHADLFRDNVLLTGDKITGVIDFYYSCTDALILDLATVANDWCIENGRFDPRRERALLRGYQSIRTLTECENALWRPYLRQCALRFWLSRLYDKLFPRSGGMVLVKDPDYFRDLLEQHEARVGT